MLNAPATGLNVPTGGPVVAGASKRSQMTFTQSLLRSVISAYRRVVSPLLPPACRFYPTCSSYAAEAVEQHGAAKGVLLTIKRLSRCHPFHPGGFDPVPGSDRGTSNDAAAPLAGLPDDTAGRAANQ